MDEMKQLELNTQEAQALVDLIDVAVKTLGLKSAGTAMHLASKIAKVFGEEESVKEPTAE